MNEYLSKGLKITVFVNLIHINGIRDEEPTEAICILTKEIKANASSSSAPFYCSIENLNETYYSFRYNYSNYIIGVPNDEVALDPILTKKAIERREILDSSDESNLPPTFIIESMDKEKCKDSGLLTFQGKISELIIDQIKLNLHYLCYILKELHYIVNLISVTEMKEKWNAKRIGKLKITGLI